ncbi:MAG: ethanolamine utilization protein EutN [spirochete symbiont of Stewartia floridana]|nr:MAG: ethanolamine utilization protein EutN [spirochete symbiont of Stewartia floridana]
MELARVVGTVVSSHKAEDMIGLKLSLVENVDPKTMKGMGSYAVAIDAVGANTGEIIFYVTGSSARYTDAGKGKPADAAIVAIVDSVEVEGRQTYGFTENSP